MNIKDLQSKNKRLTIGLVVLTIAVVFLSGALITREQIFRQSRNETNQIGTLLFADVTKVEGYACGIFSEQEAKEFLGVDEIRKNIVNMSGAVMFDGQLEIVHNDSCYYQQESKDSVYTNVLVKTYATDERALQMFLADIPPVSDTKQKDSLVQVADQVLYDAGVHYIVKGRQVIEISAANGNPSNAEEFSEGLVRILQLEL